MNTAIIPVILHHYTAYPMSEHYTHNKNITQQDLPLKGEYDQCSFHDCNFSEHSLSDLRFTDCVFNCCNLSMTKTDNTAFRDVSFKECKMLGIQFDTCNTLGLAFTFDNCQLSHSSFYKLKIKKTIFKNCQLNETDFAESDLTEAVFENCDLYRAIFDQSILEKADFRTSRNFTIDPVTNRIRKARFSVDGLSGLLEKFGIEICG